jgi:hypothetical protein
MGGGSWTGQTYNARQRAASAAGYASSFTWDDAATLADLVAERFDWFHLVIDSRKLGGMYTADHSLGAWQALLGKGRVGVLGEPGAVADAVALIVGVREGKITMDEGVADLRSKGTDLVVHPDASLTRA